MRLTPMRLLAALLLAAPATSQAGDCTTSSGLVWSSATWAPDGVFFSATLSVPVDSHGTCDGTSVQGMGKLHPIMKVQPLNTGSGQCHQQGGGNLPFVDYEVHSVAGTAVMTILVGPQAWGTPFHGWCGNVAQGHGRIKIRWEPPPP